jgi:hypothetical protein
MNLKLIFVLVILQPNKPPLEISFLELTSCLLYRNAIVKQDTSEHAIIREDSRYFRNTFCEPRLVDESQLGSKIKLFDPPKLETDE